MTATTARRRMRRCARRCEECVARAGGRARGVQVRAGSSGSSAPDTRARAAQALPNSSCTVLHGELASEEVTSGVADDRRRG